MNGAKQQADRVNTALGEWARRNGVSLTHEALHQLKELIHAQVDIHRVEALSLTREALPSFHRPQVVGRRIA